MQNKEKIYKFLNCINDNKINEEEFKHINMKDVEKYLGDEISDINKFDEVFIRENPDLMLNPQSVKKMNNFEDKNQRNNSVNSHFNVFEYYSFILFQVRKRLKLFTINGKISFCSLVLLLLDNPNDFIFYNVRNIILCDTSNKVLLSNISKMFNMRGITFMDWNVPVTDLVSDQKQDILLFANKIFYRLKNIRISYVSTNIENYYKYTNLDINNVKCDLCKKRKYKVQKMEGVIFTKRFNKFCTICDELISRVPLYK